MKQCFQAISALLLSISFVLPPPECAAEAPDSHFPSKVICEGAYKNHLQGVCMHDKHLFWSFTTAIVKTDMKGHLVAQISAPNHQGDLCIHENDLLVAVNLGPFNSSKGDANSWIYVYSPDDLTLKAKHPLPEVIYGAGGIAIADNKPFVVGGLPDNIQENYIYEYDRQFNFIHKHVLKSGHTHLGIQTAEYADGKWWFGCYGKPNILLVSDSDFNMLGRHEFNASLGIISIAQDQFYIASGQHDAQGHRAVLNLAETSKSSGLSIVQQQ